MRTLPKNCSKTIFNYFILIIQSYYDYSLHYYLLLIFFCIVILFYTYTFYCTIDGSNRHTFHYDYTNSVVSKVTHGSSS